MSKTYLSNDAYGWRVIHQGMPLTVDKKTSQAAIDAAIKAYPEIKIENQYWDGIVGEFVPVSHLQKLKNNPAKRRTAAKRAPSARKGLTAKRYVSRPSQATHKAPTKRLQARRKKVASAPAGYFPNPIDTDKEKEILSALETEMKRLKGYFPYRIIWGGYDPKNGDFESGAVSSMRIPNSQLRKGWKVFKL